MTARLTAREAKALGLTKPAAKPRTTRRTAKGGPYRTRCCTCGVEFTTAASEDRHVRDTHHTRYDLVPDRRVLERLRTGTPTELDAPYPRGTARAVFGDTP